MEKKLYVHEMASISRVGPLDRVITALIIYCLAKDVDRCGGQIKLPYPLLDFPQTCVVSCTESLIVLWCGYCPF